MVIQFGYPVGTPTKILFPQSWTILATKQALKGMLFSLRNDEGVFMRSQGSSIAGRRISSYTLRHSYARLFGLLHSSVQFVGVEADLSCS